jgi:hypothetical protein
MPAVARTVLVRHADVAPEEISRRRWIAAIACAIEAAVVTRPRSHERRVSRNPPRRSSRRRGIFAPLAIFTVFQQMQIVRQIDCLESLCHSPDRRYGRGRVKAAVTCSMRSSTLTAQSIRLRRSNTHG